MTYELWDTQSSNLIGDYDSQEAALDVVRSAYALHGDVSIIHLALGSEDDAGETRLIAQGVDLIQLAVGTSRFPRMA